MKLGLLGGTFDPIHLGHLLIAEDAREQLELDQVAFIPAGRPWLKAASGVSDAQSRLEMVEVAVFENPHFRVMDVEVRRSGPTFTVDTLEQLRGELPSTTEFFLLLGMDSIGDLARWRESGRLFGLCTVVGISRPGYDDMDPESLSTIESHAPETVQFIEGPLVNISGTDIRERVASGRSIRYRVPDRVEAYIREHGLYRKQPVGT
ncbi:MAG: nicotinate-nucleotide adenylyltransferase [SAR202 cluster bacterium]|nr:nicotinate-nucleotide adenylyltransferase [SAR202 cluster bacterium]MDP7412351.1 nicotinate-nucleotide adenylyltransferase [SAR202 cluster bacterium]MDP7535148.1 nicotinate-nucleotide adenylyltransferase [SAR202 cluster bacterium]